MASLGVLSKPLVQLTATEVLPLLLTNQLTVEFYAQSLLSHIQANDHVIKAWAHLDSDLVLASARQLDAIPPEARGPLHGIPIAVKDIILTADMPTQYNSPLHFSSSPSTVDAQIVQALRASGALIFGKTTTTEFAATVQGNVHQNFTRNAHASDRTPGGSSSGSAAAVADLQVPLALGTQTGGSVIRPASFNGVWGMKWTWGAVSREGVGQYAFTCDTLGVLGRCADDLYLVSRVLGLDDDRQVPAAMSEATHMKGARIGFCRTHVWDEKAGPGLKVVWEKAKNLLDAAGATIEELKMPAEFANISKWHADVLAGEGRSSFLGAYMTDKRKLAPFLCEHVENVKKTSRSALLEAYDGVANLRPIWDKLAREYDVIVTPSVPDEAPVGLGYTGDACFNLMWTILHAPTVNVPGLVGEDGMPIGLTVVGARYTDVSTLNMARRIGDTFSSSSRAI